MLIFPLGLCECDINKSRQNWGTAALFIQCFHALMKWPRALSLAFSVCSLTPVSARVVSIAESLCYIWYLLLLISSIGAACIRARSEVRNGPPRSTRGNVLWWAHVTGSKKGFYTQVWPSFVMMNRASLHPQKGTCGLGVSSVRNGRYLWGKLPS